MKFRFEADLDYQRQAVEAVCDLFRGQEKRNDSFALTAVPASLGVGHNGFGLSNQLQLTDGALLQNLRAVQHRNNLRQSEELESLDFTVEMETGTGKTYVYLRTIFELNRRFGFTKFAIVVPSLAIKEGVLKALQITQGHFQSLYPGVLAEHFVYDSAKVGFVRNFAANAFIQIMVMTVGSINRSDVNVIYSPNEKTGGEKPIDLISATSPVVIVDEPQSVDGGLQGRGREALASMKPLCTLRYSATHVDQRNMVYRLDAVDAYRQGLVKEIEVASARIMDGTGKPYVRLVEAKRSKGVISAKIEIDVANADGGVLRRTKTVHNGEDLARLANLDAYRGLRVGEIRLSARGGLMELRVPGEDIWLAAGEAHGAPDSGDIHREMVHRTIREHFDKEKRLAGAGIKVLSLFFVDRVADYREYRPDGSSRKGAYALMFEEEYRRLAKNPDYCDLFGGVDDLEQASDRAHDGYFSADSSHRWVNTDENSQASREKAERAYNLIMRDKEELLNIGNPLKFVFSHSALREGWDNPNVFQICALRDMHGEVERRQTLGRGLRLCVNQEGERIHDRSLNTLTVIARESYEEYAAKLQIEMEEQTGIRFGVVGTDQFAGLQSDETGELLGDEQSAELWGYLRENGYLDSDARVSARFRIALKSDSVKLPPKFESLRTPILRELKRCAGDIMVKNADERRVASPRRAVLDSAEFGELWDRIKHKTAYRVDFDNEDLLLQCAEELKSSPTIQLPHLRWETARVDIGAEGVSAVQSRTSAPIGLPATTENLPDLLTELQNLTQLTRKSLARILHDSGRISDFTRNPRKFIETASQIIKKCKRRQIVDGIKYQRLGDGHFYSQQLFETKELVGYLRSMLPAEKSVFDHVIYESETERAFAIQLENSEAVKIYAKLPNWFRIPTPLGSYIPDWALVIGGNEGEKVYFVAETKGSHDLRESERDKIASGKKYFEALATRENSVKYEVVRNLDELIARSGM